MGAIYIDVNRIYINPEVLRTSKVGVHQLDLVGFQWQRDGDGDVQ